MRAWTKGVKMATLVGLVAWSSAPEAATAVSVPLTCNHGPDGQRAELLLTIPATIEEGATFTVRVDGKNSGPISHTGLRYIHGMTTMLVIPEGTSYVNGSARIVPETGTENVRPGARVGKDGHSIALVLPARVESGSNYTPPSFEFQVRVTAPAGSRIEQRFWQYRVTANAIIVGDVKTVCDPRPKPYTIGTTTVTAARSQP